MQKFQKKGLLHWIHDCEHCIYVASMEGPTLNGIQKLDMWYHPGSGMHETVILRYGDDGPDYMSGIVFLDSESPEWRWAKHVLQNKHWLSYRVTLGKLCKTCGCADVMGDWCALCAPAARETAVLGPKA
jgi:hypothetical protein